MIKGHAFLLDLFAIIAFKRESKNFYCRNSWKSDKKRKDIESDNFSYRNVGKAIPILEAIEKSSKLLCENLITCPKTISYQYYFR